MKIIVLIAFVCTAVISYAQIPSYVPSNGLVGWWPFNGNANDESGNGNDGTVNGATLTSDRNGVANNAYNLSTLIDNLTMINVQPQLNSNNLSISFWMKFPTQYNQSSLALVKNGTPYINGFDVAIDQNNSAYGVNNYKVFFIVGNGASVSFTSNQNELGVWSNIVSIYDGSNIKIYLNGILKATQSFNQSMNILDNNVLIGSWDNPTTPVVQTRQLDDIGIWNRALTEQEILVLYQGCQQLISSQPTNQSVNLSGGNASFNVASNATNPTYQWQTNLGFGFQNLSNAGQYSGVNTANLSVSNLTLANDNQVFRCIISEAGCVDTSDIATLSIIDDASINSQLETSLILSPNPISNDFSISGIEQIVSLSLKDVSGKLIKTFDVQDKNHSLTNVTSGVYFLEVRDEKRTYMIKVIKE